jgi:hypothetical protein
MIIKIEDSVISVSCIKKKKKQSQLFHLQYIMEMIGIAMTFNAKISAQKMQKTFIILQLFSKTFSFGK